MEEKEKKRKERFKGLMEWVIDLTVAIGLAVLVSFIIKPTIVREISMVPTLEDGDYLLLNRMATPKRGDIVVFKTKLKGEDGKNKMLIKRVIAVEGDSIEIKSKGDKSTVLINGEKEKDSYTNNGTNLSELEKIDSIPKGKYFCMGDNRDVSRDSRELGLIDKKNMVGVVFVRLMPISKFRKF